MCKQHRSCDNKQYYQMTPNPWACITHHDVKWTKPGDGESCTFLIAASYMFGSKWYFIRVARVTEVTVHSKVGKKLQKGIFWLWSFLTNIWELPWSPKQLPGEFSAPQPKYTGIRTALTFVLRERYWYGCVSQQESALQWITRRKTANFRLQMFIQLPAWTRKSFWIPYRKVHSFFIS